MEVQPPARTNTGLKPHALGDNPPKRRTGILAKQPGAREVQAENVAQVDLKVIIELLFEIQLLTHYLGNQSSYDSCHK